MPDTADKVNAYLAQVRERSNRPLGPSTGALPISSDAVRHLMESAADVPRLLAAVETALKLHVPVDRGRVMNCCRGCEEENGTFHEDCCHEWPCPTYEALSAALLGEEGEA